MSRFSRRRSMDFKKKLLFLIFLSSSVCFIYFYYMRPAAASDSTESDSNQRFYCKDGKCEVLTNRDRGRSAGLRIAESKLFLNGKEFRIIGGSFHYFRTHPEQWQHRLNLMKLAGLNTVTTYIPWNLHETEPDVYDFETWNIERFIEMVKATKLNMIIRPGPYICAEWEFGGLPYWLLRDPNMQVRTLYRPFMDRVEKYFGRLLPLLKKYQYQYGGPIIAFQVENEYGSYGGDKTYMASYLPLFSKYGINELLLTSDGDDHLDNGTIPGVWATINFKGSPAAKLNTLKKFQPNMPLMVTEYWPGWFDHWNESHHRMSVEEFQTSVDIILSMGASINFYMFTGGTNFGFWNGANYMSRTSASSYAPTITSYDYDTLIGEDGNCHPKKYPAFLKLLEKHKLISSVPEVPQAVDSRDYGTATLLKYMTFDDMRNLITDSVMLPDTVFMEFLNTSSSTGQGYGWILYRTAIGRFGKLQVVGEFHDLGYIFVNGKLIHKVFQTDDQKMNFSIDLHDLETTNTLEILVENLGRVNYRVLNQQRKGFQGEILTDNKRVNGWKHYSFDFSKSFIKSVNLFNNWKSPPATSSPSLHKGVFVIDSNPVDTFVDMEKWTKGIVIINGFNIGRYWKIGPQRTLYVPAPLLKKGENEIFIFELEKASTDVSLVNMSILNNLRVIT